MSVPDSCNNHTPLSRACLHTGRILLLMAVYALCAPVIAQSMPPVFGSARWIGATSSQTDTLAGRSIYLKHDLRCTRPVARATVAICGLGCYELEIYHQKVNPDIMLAPAWSDYRKTLFYNTYDITAELRQAQATAAPTRHIPQGQHGSKRGHAREGRGKLGIGVLLGNSFYHEQGLRYHKLKTHYGPLSLLFRLCITYQDGSQEVVESNGEGWQWCPSALTYNSLYGGEDHDARIDHTQAYQPVVVQPAPAGQLRPQIAAPVMIMERYPVARRLGARVFDMGQNLAGFPEIRVRGKRGQQVKLIVGETLQADGHVSQKQTGKPYYLTYTLRGDTTEDELWHPRFTYYGYQYIEVEGAVMQGDDNPQGLPVIQQLSSCLISNSAPTIGAFACSNPRFNQTYRLIDRAIRSNWQHVWTDCPHREKLGWLEQDWLNGEGLAYNYDVRSMIEQTMVQIADAQHTDGSLPEIAPEYIRFEGAWAPPFQESPEWGGALIALPFLYMQHYTDSSLVRTYYPAMRRYVDYLHRRDSAYVLNFGLGDWYDYGPGRAGFSKNTPIALVATAHYYRWARLTAEAAAISGSPQAEANRYRQLADSIRSAFQQTFYHPESGSYGTGSQCSNAIPLVMGIVDEADRRRVMASLKADIARHGNRLTTGDVGTRYLMDALAWHGEGDLLYQMLNHDDLPGYGYQITQGMTTLAEQWDPAMGASRNHFMMGHINNLLIPWIVGIRTDGHSITIAPHPVGDLTWAEGSTVIKGQPIRVRWQIAHGLLTLNIYSRNQHNIHIDDEEMDTFCTRRHLQLQCNLFAE